MKKIKIFVVDDSAVVRQVLQTIIEATPDLEFMGAAADPIFAMRHLEKQWPDVILTDIEMPRMDGITFLKKIMAERPTPVVVCTSMNASGPEVAMRALAAGAVDVINKPQHGVKQFLENSMEGLRSVMHAAVQANVQRLRPSVSAPPPPKLNADSILPMSHRAVPQGAERVVVIGASTGGTQALEAVLTALPTHCPPIVIVQHMPEKFTEAFALRLNELCKIEVKEARDTDQATVGRALIAPGGRHLLLRRSGTHYFVEVRDGPPVNRHRPSVDVLFRSAAQCAGKNALGIIMTGMGDDGARGLKEMRDEGAYTVAQDEHSCVVYGMPKEAVKLGAADKIISLEHIPKAIMDYAAAKAS